VSIRILDVIERASPYSSQKFYYIVVDRKPSRVYARDGNRLTSSDDGFHDFLQIDPGTKLAFGGREFDIELSDGSVYHATGDVWSVGAPMGFEQTVGVGINTLEGLDECYVFTSASISAEKLSAWLAENTPSTNYYKHDRKSSVDYLAGIYRQGARNVSAARARTLRKRG
jgi:hypothetical protein